MAGTESARSDGRPIDEPTIRALIVDDDSIVAGSLAELLEEAGYPCDQVGGANEAMTALREGSSRYQLLLTEMNLPGMGGLELIRHARKHHEQVVAIAVTGYGTIESAVEAVKAGAFDYLTKPIVDEELIRTVERAARQQMLLHENATLRSRLGDSPLGEMVAADPKMLRVRELVSAVADSRTTVLIQGESGTGKTMVARAIHNQSGRAEQPFITLSCGSIPETLLESELFGHVKGAFTGADRDKPGKLLAANGGTLLIDEINSAPLALQVKLLRALQDRCFEPVGSHETVNVDVRFVLAANESLETLVAEGRFREDLYYRINVVTLELPPLRQRESDVPRLAASFIDKYCRETGKVVTGFSEEAQRLLRTYNWPGNVRELENAVERAVVLTRGPVIQPDVLPERISHQRPDGRPGFRERRRNPQGFLPADWTPQPLREAIKEPERRIILATLKANDWNRQRTAEVLDINRTTLYKKIKQYGLEELEASG